MHWSFPDFNDSNISSTMLNLVYSYNVGNGAWNRVWYAIFECDLEHFPGEEVLLQYTWQKWQNKGNRSKHWWNLTFVLISIDWFLSKSSLNKIYTFTVQNVTRDRRFSPPSPPTSQILRSKDTIWEFRKVYRKKTWIIQIFLISSIFHLLYFIYSSL